MFHTIRLYKYETHFQLIAKVFNIFFYFFLFSKTKITLTHRKILRQGQKTNTQKTEQNNT